MRINVYSEEMGEPVTIVRKYGVNGSETFFGVRMWLKSPKELLDHSTPEDDDRSAITFWSRNVTDLEVFAEDIMTAVREYRQAHQL